METALALRTKLIEAGCSFTAEIAAHLDDGTAEFTVDCECSPDGITLLRVTEPNTIAGITATVEPGAEEARFEDTGLEFGLLADGQVAPMALPQLLFGCWTGGFIREAGQDRDVLSAVYLSGYGEKELALEQFLDAEGIPTAADLWFGTKNLASVTITNFKFGE